MRISSFLWIMILALLLLSSCKSLEVIYSGTYDGADGILFYSYNLSDSCDGQIFIGDNDSICFQCQIIKKVPTKAVDISSEKEIIAQLRKLITFRYIRKLRRCCARNNCSDGPNGYYISLARKGTWLWDGVDSPKCFGKRLNKIINLFNQLKAKYQNGSIKP